MRHILLLLIVLVSRPILGCDPDRIQSMSPATEEHLSALVTCLASPDPELRDQLAYTTLAKILRDEKPATGQLEFLSDQLDGLLQQPDPVGVAHPFAILVFAEIARTDRIESWMSPPQRQALVDKAGNYLENVADYRGFDREVGWRHGVAHGADLAMQLALNPALSKAQQLRLLQAIGQQVAPAHAYRFGESTRLARPVLFLAMQEELDEQGWQAWFAKLTDPAPLSSWEAGWQDADALARRHNLRAFALEIYINATLSEQPGIQAMEPRALQVLEALR
ncbi:MAG: DUF2785 domain-containing protein [Gammaproteobacteria bacterium]|nr:DUF2785 domain-containing protein [Gammaproteobacteria bacterium]